MTDLLKQSFLEVSIFNIAQRVFAYCRTHILFRFFLFFSFQENSLDLIYTKF